MGFEPTTTCLASKSSTPELPPHIRIYGDQGRTQTLNLRVRSAMLYSVELPDHRKGIDPFYNIYCRKTILPYQNYIL